MGSKKSNWREAHKELTEQIRSARDGYSGQASGGAGSGPSRQPTGASAKQADLQACKHCSRTFTADRIQVHERICARTSKRKTKQFNSFKQRISGTGAENFLHKGKPSAPPKKLESGNWRKQHQDLISSLKYARGGKQKGATPPAPPPLDTSDYVQCPHCGRRFNETAAARHIPACATMIHNKPKPNTPKK
ncbi:zinc finger C2HC domain-containing protein 1B [Nilaparvata lugens]|uniref:zinc finger C2HC domain-containing protein 1B n=1 Tax=Nilaparvata lugens TaxID=108931 RepID=UPI00193EBAA0|nr:zinc finger C2HC domain-containing protein 1B [Nilaparvata lugens]